MFAALTHNNEFWVAAAFVLIVVVAWRPAQRRLGAMLDERAALIKTELDEAQRLREEAERALAEYQAKQREALQKAEQIVALAHEDAERAAERARRDLADAIERRRRLGAERIALEEQKAMTEVRNFAVDVAIDAAGRILARDLDKTRRARLIDEAIRALPRQLAS
ncbi:MAG TPA: F0F1 ATP synthase subunit B [Beijerinckiaceae bacterium]|nr:F0F1 ATP synthase subunit B [Beijerinckiaceae bacterium]